MKNKLMVGALLLCLVGGMAFGRNYDLDEEASINLSGVKEVTFDLRGVSCSLCIRSVDILSEISGDGSGTDMQLRLEGSIDSNREKAVPSLYVDESGRRISVRLFPDRKSFFGLNQSGTAEFIAVLPAGFDGTVIISGASEDIVVRNLGLEILDVRTSSGDLDAEDIDAGTISLSISSGDMRGNNLMSEETLVIDSSSGKLSLGYLQGSEIDIEASSGDITINETIATDILAVKASSGRITAGTLTAEHVEMDSSSGRIEVEVLTADSVVVEASSGDVSFDRIVTRNADFDLSSGDLSIGEIEADQTVIKTSGDTVIRSLSGAVDLNGSSGTVEIGFSRFEDLVVIDVSSGDITLAIPEGSGFDAELETSSGKIRSEFALMGDLSADNDGMNGTVNGGGPVLQAETSSGDIYLLAR